MISPQKELMHSIKKTPNAHHRSSKAFLLMRKMLLQILAARFTRKNEKERERSGRDLGSINLL
jgi:hypothetical protein